VKVEKHSYLLSHITDDNYLSLIDDNNEPVEYFKVPENETGEKIRNYFDRNKQVKITTIHAGNQEMIYDSEIIE